MFRDRPLITGGGVAIKWENRGSITFSVPPPLFFVGEKLPPPQKKIKKSHFVACGARNPTLVKKKVPCLGFNMGMVSLIS